jgi:hypothetical protein
LNGEEKGTKIWCIRDNEVVLLNKRNEHNSFWTFSFRIALKMGKHRSQTFRVNEENLMELLNFDEKITINIKKRNKQLYKIRKSLNLNNNIFKINKGKSCSGSSGSSGDSGKGVNIIFRKKFKCFYTNATSLAKYLSLKLGFKGTLAQVSGIIPCIEGTGSVKEMVEVFVYI